MMGRVERLADALQPRVKPAARIPQGGQGSAGYDNPRENIDPHIKTRVLDTLEGTIQQTPTTDKHIANKKYVDDAVSAGGLTYGTVVTELSFGQAQTDGVLSSVSRSDHTHGTPANPGSANNSQVSGALTGKGVIISASAANTIAIKAAGVTGQVLGADTDEVTGLRWFSAGTGSTQAFGDAATEGSAMSYSRSDHKHGMPANPTGQVSGALSAKGSLITATAANTVSELSAGSTGSVLVANTGTSTGLEWVSGARVLYTEELTNSGVFSISGAALASCRAYELIVKARFADERDVNQDLALRFNGDTGTNYTWSHINVNESTVAGDSGTGGRYARLGVLGNLSRRFSTVRALIVNNNPGQKRSLTYANFNNGGAQAGSMGMQQGGSGWENTTDAITRMDLSVGTLLSPEPKLASGSRVVLVGLIA